MPPSHNYNISVELGHDHRHSGIKSTYFVITKIQKVWRKEEGEREVVFKILFFAIIIIIILAVAKCDVGKPHDGRISEL